MIEDYDVSEEDIAHATTPQPETQITQKLPPLDTEPANISPDNDINSKFMSGNQHTIIDNCLGKGNKPVLKRLSSLNLGDSNTLLYDPDARGLSIHSNNLTTSLQDTRLLKNLDKVERFYSKPSTSANSYKTNDAFIKPGVYDKEIQESSKNISVLGSDKWGTTKEKFLENEQFALSKTSLEKDATDFTINLLQPDEKTKCEKSFSKDLQVPKVSLGAVLIKESFIEPPRISRISKSFHGKSSSSSNADISSSPRRASDSVSSLHKKQDDPPDTLKNMFPTSKAPKSPRRSSEVTFKKPVNVDRQFVTQLSQPCPSNVAHSSNRKTSLNMDSVASKNRFTTTLVGEAEHAASVNQQSEVMMDTDPTLTLASSSQSSITHGFHVDRNK